MRADFEKHSEIINAINLAIFKCRCDEALTLVYANKDFYTLLRTSKEQLEDEMNNSLMSVILNDINKDLLLKSLEELSHKGKITVQIKTKKIEGVSFWLELEAQILCSDKEEFIYGRIIDITCHTEIYEMMERNEIKTDLVMSLANIQSFEYTVKTKTFINSNQDIERYNVHKVIENGVEQYINSGVVCLDSVGAFRAIFRRIDSGVKHSSGIVNLCTVDGHIDTVKISTTTIFDGNGRPVKAIGIKKDITQKLKRKKEKNKYSMLEPKILIKYEANLTQDIITRVESIQAHETEDIDYSSYSALIESELKRCDSQECLDAMRENMLRDNLIKSFEQGKLEFSFDYQRKTPIGKILWHKVNINLSKEIDSIILKFQVNEIDFIKKHGIKVDGKRVYEHKSSKAVEVYEINMSKNVFDVGPEEWGLQYGEGQKADLKEFSESVLKKIMHKEDYAMFQNLKKESIIEMFMSGTNEISYEYRRLNDEGEYVWVECTLHLFMDSDSGDIKSYVYIEDIDEEKKQQLQLLYKAEHDLLTTCYNKAATHEKIKQIIDKSDINVDKHAFLIVDLDFFKEINDNFGHSFGDEVLVEVSGKIKRLFRECDIIGRIGGDEFVVFMRNVPNMKIVAAKVLSLCQTIKKTYEQNDTESKMSASIGVAVYPKDGTTYEDLYKNADEAMYVSKKMGKNTFTIYDDKLKFLSEKNVEKLHLQGIRQASVDLEETMKKGIDTIIYTVINAMNTYAYQVDEKTYTIQSANDKLQYLIEDPIEGQKCYEVLWRRNRPCDNCPVEAAKNGDREHSTVEMFNPVLGMDVKITATKIMHVSREERYVVSCEDITN